MPEELTKKVIFEYFANNICPCGARKWTYTAFCFECENQLSADVLKRLGKRFGQGFEDAFRDGINELGRDENDDKL